MFSVYISRKDNKIEGKFVIDSYFFEPAKYQYAFYLYKDRERVDVAWYTKSTEVDFEIKGMTGLFYIKAFLKDIEQGNTRHYDSEEIRIE